MAHSHIEIGDRFLHWPDSRILTVFSLLLHQAETSQIAGTDVLRTSLAQNLNSPVSGMCDVNLDPVLAADIDLGSLTRDLRDKVAEKPFVSGALLNKIALNAPNAGFEDCDSDVLLRWLDAFSAFLEHRQD